MKKIYLILLAVVLFNQSVLFGEDTIAPKPQKTDYVCAYYFHGDFRCSNCYKIEKYSKEAIDKYFAKELWLEFPLLSNPLTWMGKAYGAYSEKAPYLQDGSPNNFGRRTVVIDKKGIVRHEVVNDLGLGRNIDESLRMLDALKFNDEHGDVCPANWHEGEEAMKPTAEGVAEYLSKHVAHV